MIPNGFKRITSLASPIRVSPFIDALTGDPFHGETLLWGADTTENLMIGKPVNI